VASIHRGLVQEACDLLPAVALLVGDPAGQPTDGTAVYTSSVLDSGYRGRVARESLLPICGITSLRLA
jgi:hypothetical protein